MSWGWGKVAFRLILREKIVADIFLTKCQALFQVH